MRSARNLVIDSLTLYAAGSAGKTPSLTVTTGLAAITAGLTTAGSATLDFPADSQVMVRTQTQQVFAPLQDHFGANA